MSREDLTELLYLYEQFSKYSIVDVRILKALRNIRDSIDEFMSRARSSDKKALLDNVLAHGGLSVASQSGLIKAYQSKCRNDGSKEADLLQQLCRLLEAASEGPGIDRSTVRNFLRLHRSFVAHEFANLAKEMKKRAKEATSSAERTAWAEQAEDFEELEHANASPLDERAAAATLKELRLSAKDSAVSNAAFCEFLIAGILPALPERWFLEGLRTKESRTLVSQMSLRFSSSLSTV